jgi:hypothetical protein
MPAPCVKIEESGVDLLVTRGRRVSPDTDSSFRGDEYCFNSIARHPDVMARYLHRNAARLLKI